MVVEYEGYLIEQSEDEPEAFVYRGNRRVMHELWRPGRNAQDPCDTDGRMCDLR